MKRKRFIKLLMSKGIQRNEANRRAGNVKYWRSYKDFFNSCFSTGIRNVGVRDMIGNIWEWVSG